MSRESVNRTGFTLVEVMVVLVIIGIAGAVVVPHMLSGGQFGVQAAARVVIADIIYAQNEAVAHQSPRRVVFEPDNNRYMLTDTAGTTMTVSWKSSAQENYIVDFEQDQRFSGVTLENVDFGGMMMIEFDDMGSPISGGTLELIAAGFRYRITVAAFTGQVTIESVPGG